MKKFFASLVCIVAFLSVVGCTDERKPVQPDPTIEGVITDVKYIAQVASLSSIRQTIITFEDGKVKAFEGISDCTFQKGKMNIVTYHSRYGYIISVVVK